MKKIFLLIALVILTLQSGFSQIVDKTTALTVAKNIYFERANIAGKVNYSDITFNQDFVISHNQQPVYYVFNVSGNRGFVIVSAEARSMPVLFYTFEGNYTTENQPENFTYWLNGFEKQIVAAREANITLDKKVADSWAYYSAATLPSTKTPTKAIAALLTTNWDQGCYYDAQCPAITDYSLCNHCPTGCVATAMAMVMRYHSYPAHGYGTHSYVHSTANGYSNNFGTLSADFGNATYNWGSMPNSVNSTNSSVATIMYHCGVAVEMDYDNSGSGAYIINASGALATYFVYSTKYGARSMYTDTDWTLLIKTSLDSLRPVIYGGQDPTYGGHCFVCDGYQNSGTYSDMFHFNWGWSGSSNGYIYLSSITPSMTSENFSTNQEIVYEIHPQPATAPVANFTASNTNPVPNGLVVFTNTSTNSPIDYLWTITPNTGITYVSGSSTTSKNINVRFANVGYYTVKMQCTNSAGTDSETKTDYIHVYDAGIEQVGDLKNLSIYPNPSNGIINIQTGIATQKDVSVKVYDVIGKEVSNSLYALSASHDEMVLNLSKCQKGLYFIKVTTPEGSVTKKVELTK
jgi:PKD repeat protein